MPELPEVETTLRGISPYLKDHTITRIDVRQPKLRWPVEDEIQSLAGQKVLSLSRRSKYILVETDANHDFAIHDEGFHGLTFSSAAIEKMILIKIIGQRFGAKMR